MNPTRKLLPKPFLKWAGGKRQLLPELLWAVSAAGEFGNYHEPFLGGGALFFAMAGNDILHGRKSFLSDINRNLLDVYAGIRDDVEEVIGFLVLHRARHCREHFYRVREKVPTETSERAARIIYLNKTCFNGLYRENNKGEFNVPFGRHKNPLICDETNLRVVSRILQPTTLSAKPFERVQDDVASGDLVYFDPPYAPISRTADFTTYAKGGFGYEEHRKLAELAICLAGRGVKVILSNSLTEFTKGLYGGFHIREIPVRRIIGSFNERRGQVTEILATSFPVLPELECHKSSDIGVRV